MRYPCSAPESNHLLTVRGATLQIFATCPVVKIVLIAGSPIRFSWPLRGFVGPSGSSPLARWPALLATRSVTYKNHRGLGSGSQQSARGAPKEGPPTRPAACLI